MHPYFSLLAQIFGRPTFTTNTVDPSLLLKSIGSSCPADSPISCQNATIANTCCVEMPGGLLLQTQFWDTNVPGGPPDSWTIHGLWPDNCDGTYIENCDPSRNYNIRELLTEQGATSTLDYMRHFWLNSEGTNEHLWNHEWSTHGTCYSTLDPTCIPQESPQGSEAVSYFQTVVQLFQTLPTYTWLANAGITPTWDQTYSLSDIISALEQGAGYTPAVGCSHHGQLNTISWYFNLQGSLLDGKFVPINSPKHSTCPHDDIRYPPKEVSPQARLT